MLAPSGEANSVFTELRKRIDRVVLVTAPDDAKIARYVGPHRRLAPQPRGSRGRCPLPARPPDPRQRKSRVAPTTCLKTPAISKHSAPRSRDLWPRLKQESNLNLRTWSLK